MPPDDLLGDCLQAVGKLNGMGGVQYQVQVVGASLAVSWPSAGGEQQRVEFELPYQLPAFHCWLDEQTLLVTRTVRERQRRQK